MASIIKVVSLTPAMVTGSIVHAVAAAISIVAVLSLAAWLGYASYRNPRPSLIIQQLGLNFVGLLVADISLGTSGLMQLFWVGRGAISEGMMCTTQGLLYQLGSFGSAIFSFSVTAHAFTVLVRGEPPSRLLCVGLLWIGCIVTLILNIGVPFILEKTLKAGNFFGVGDQTCGISTAYALPHIFMHCAPIIFSIIFMFLFLLLRGKLLPGSGAPSNFVQIVSRTGKQIIWFPTAYASMAIPTVVVHALTIFGHTVPSAWWSVTSSTFSLLGATHVLFFLTAREQLGFSMARRPVDVEKGASPEATLIDRRSTSNSLGDQEKNLKVPSGLATTRQKSPPEWKPPSNRSTARSDLYAQVRVSEARNVPEIDLSWITGPVEVCPSEASGMAIPQSPLIPGTPTSAEAARKGFEPRSPTIAPQGVADQPRVENIANQGQRLPQAQPGFL